MSFRSHSPKVLAICLSFLMFAVPSFAAAGKRRSVTPTAPAPSFTGKVRGTVTDAGTGRPVVFATVSAGEASTTTDNLGNFEFEVDHATALTVTRSGYQKVTVPAAATVAVRMTGLPTVHVRTTSNKEYDLDFDSSQFAYAVPFSGYVRDERAKWCKPDGSEFRPDRSTIKRVIGPATSAAAEACCGQGKSTLKVRVEMKSGETTDVFFIDACVGYEVDFIGRDHVSGEFVYLKFPDIAEIVFP